jgi:hypothetical protein
LRLAQRAYRRMARARWLRGIVNARSSPPLGVGRYSVRASQSTSLKIPGTCHLCGSNSDITHLSRPHLSAGLCISRDTISPDSQIDLVLRKSAMRQSYVGANSCSLTPKIRILHSSLLEGFVHYFYDTLGSSRFFIRFPLAHPILHEIHRKRAIHLFSR